MEYLIDLKFEDVNLSAYVHFVTTFKVNSEHEAKLFVDELEAGFKRKGVIILPSTFYRIDNDPVLRQNSFNYYNFYVTRATASIKIEQFIIENPDQNKSLVENLTERLFNGEKSTAIIGEKYNIPVRVFDKKTRNPINSDIFYFGIEQLIKK